MTADEFSFDSPEESVEEGVGEEEFEEGFRFPLLTLGLGEGDGIGTK
jgi:hypothetical protein